jgi:hypothetical protein
MKCKISSLIGSFDPHISNHLTLACLEYSAAGTPSKPPNIYFVLAFIRLFTTQYSRSSSSQHFKWFCDTGITDHAQENDDESCNGPQLCQRRCQEFKCPHRCDEHHRAHHKNQHCDESIDLLVGCVVDIIQTIKRKHWWLLFSPDPVLSESFPSFN